MSQRKSEIGSKDKSLKELGVKEQLKRLSAESDIKLVALALAITVGFGLAAASFQGVGKASIAILWGVACLACGGIIGFLFGIPRVLQRDTPAVAEPPRDKPAAEDANAASPQSASSYQMQVNTNLEQISDWLTKIIVGIGLIEMRKFPDLLQRGSAFIAKGFVNLPPAQTLAQEQALTNAQVFAYALILYFSILGFLGGYLLTRLFLAGAFRRADEQVVTDSSNEIQQLRVTVGDLMTQVVTGGDGSGSMGEGMSADEKKITVHTILWVDDFPENNGLIKEYLEMLSIEVVQVRSTVEALAQLKSRKTYDRIISDMGREEGGANNPRAGIDLVIAVRETLSIPKEKLPIAIYCSVNAAKMYGDEAKRLGAQVVTPSQTDLIRGLQLYE
jgi:CheY-like chemotaxis protein